MTTTAQGIGIAISCIFMWLALGIFLIGVCGRLCGYCYCRISFEKCDTCKYKITPTYPSTLIDP